MSSAKMKRLTVDLPEDLHTRFKIGCVETGTTMNDFIRDVLEDAFPAAKKRKRARTA